MATFTGGNGTHTPSASADNWTLDQGTTAGAVGKVKFIAWGGRGTTSTGYRTRWTRPTTNASSTFTSLNASGNPAGNPLAASVLRLGTFATPATLATDPASNLFAIDWNVLGGGGILVLPIGGEWLVAYSATAGHGEISCRNVAGTDAALSSYQVAWEE